MSEGDGYDHDIGMNVQRQLQYSFELGDGDYIRIEVSDHVYVYRVRQARDSRYRIVREDFLAEKMFVANSDTLDHARARIRAFLHDPKAHVIAWEVFWDLCVVPAYLGQDGGWLAASFDDHARRWLSKEADRRNQQASAVLES